ncbi:hypothetical protein ACVW0Y_003464 [Pseudomonas sp. TE3786]
MSLPLRSLLLAGLLALGACQSRPVPPPAAELSPEQQRRVQFTHDAQNAIWRRAFVSNVASLQGSLQMVFSIDKNARVVACEIEPYSAAAPGTPPYNAILAAHMQSVCWSTVLPELPVEAGHSEEVTKLLAPLIFPAQDRASEERRARMRPLQARSQFFWERTLASETLDSIGVARFELRADAQGVVQSCEVVIDPHPLRRREFKQDNALVQRLSERCLHLDLRQMPYFQVGKDGIASGQVSVEYTPWRNGPLTVPKP